MKILFIGGTGNISAASSKLAVERGMDLYLLTRGTSKTKIEGAKNIIGDISKEEEIAKILEGHQWDAVVNWIGFTAEEMERDIRLFSGKTKQYVFISSASAYQKPAASPFITESTPLANPYWDYSRDKIACEERLNKEYRDNGFPITIVRPSLTYGDTVIPAAIGSWNDFTLIDRIRKGKKMISHGDGTSLWTITHSDDFAVGLVGLLGSQQAKGNAFHITSDEILSWDQIYEAIAEAAGVKPEIIHIPSDFISKFKGWEWMEGNLQGDKAVSVIFDNTKLKRAVPDFNATISFQEGIKRTVDWFDADPERQTIVKDMDNFMDRVIAAYEKGIAAIDS
jgi:nucleoside-diphosphate-sugar epimerase